jgi:hypothetical protein
MLDDRITQENTLIVENSLVTTVYLNATIDDSNTGNSNISYANYTIGKDNWPSSKIMDTIDGAFDEPIENVTITINISSWPMGTYQLWVYASDAWGNRNITGLNATLIIQDTKAPQISNVLLDDGVTQANVLAVEYCQMPIVYLNTTIYDTITGNSNISFANYTLGAGNWSSSTLMLPTDGSFNSPTEDVYATIDISSWSIGTYELWVYGSDDLGNLNLTGAYATLIIQDRMPPIIIDVTALPDPQEVFGAVNISSNVTDNYQLSEVCIEIYDPDLNFVGNFSMLNDPVNGRYYWNRTYDILGTYSFTIWANDTNNNWGSVSDTYVIQDTTPPTITNSSALPDPREVFGAVNISVSITDNYQLFGEWIEIYDPDGAFVGNFSMLYNSTNGRYYWNQTYDIVGIYNFIIWANDTSNNWDSIPGTFLIQDITLPMILDASALPDPQEVFNFVNISANVTDNYQLFGRCVEIYDPDGNFIGNSSMLYDPVNGRYYWNQSYDVLGTYTFTIWVNDTSDNWASASDTFVIQDTTTPMITDVMAVPNPQEVFDFVNVSANVTDNYQQFGTWIEIYDPDGNFIGNFSMLYDSVDERYYRNLSYDIVGIYTFTIWANDTSDNWASASSSFVIQDTTSPLIYNLQPPDESTINESTPIISADYSDPSGINVSCVILEVDGIDVTSSATVTASGVSYLPGEALLDEVHNVYLEVKDTNGNLATTTWSFTVDATPPIITNLQPPDTSITNDNASIISADYSDPSGINLSSVLLEVDGTEVTSSAVITASGVSYIPGRVLSDDVYTVYLEVEDIYGNLATITWSFTVDTSPPVTTINPDNYTVKIGTIFTLNATDGDLGSGVNYTQYKIDDGEWTEYSVPFSIDTYEYHNITYRSVDNLGNIENENILSIYVPNAPMTTIIIGTPQYGTTPRYVNCSTQFSFSVIDYSGKGHDTYYYIDTSPLIPYIGPFIVPTEGAHTIYYYSIDNLGNIEDTKEFDIIVDNTPPTTYIAIGDPNYVSGDTWVTSDTEFTLNVIDGGLIPVGINYTMYRIWNGVWSDWSIYQNEFTLGAYEGIRYIELFSVDWLGNAESINNRTYIVDNAPPTTAISVGIPRYKDSPNDIWNVTSDTTFTLSAIDNGVGLNYTEYRIWDNGSWSDWYKYTDGFRLDSGNGTRDVEWYSVDYLGNIEMTPNQTYFIDNIPPETNYLIQLEPDNTEARISLIPSDVGSGVNFTKYRIDSGDWVIYSDTFLLNESGLHTIYFFSADKLGNLEKTNEVSVLVEEPEPTPSDDERELNHKPMIALIFAIILLLVGSYVSYKRPLKLKEEIAKNRLLTWLIFVLPFVVAEAITGIISLLTGMLSVPPLLGVGMIVDLAILIIGLVADGYTYKKGQEIEVMATEL